MQSLDLRHCSLVNEERQSYFVVLHGVLAMAYHHASKELFGK